jgi:hypothetical protein
MDRVQQVQIIDGFGKKFNRPGFDGSHGHAYITVTGDEDRRDVEVCLDQLLLQFQAIYFGQAHIQYQTPRVTWAPLQKEFPCRPEKLDTKSGRTQ